MTSPTGRYVRINTKNPDAVAICDTSGMVCNYSDLVKQMEWRGKRLVWTGYMVNKEFYDEPQPQNIPLTLPPDPPPIPNPRPPIPFPEGNKGSTILPYDANLKQLENINFTSPG